MEKHSIEQSFLFRLRNKKLFAVKLGLPPGFFRHYRKIIKYSISTTPKKDGKPRIIQAPGDELKAVQKKILEHLNRIYKEPWLISGRKGKSYIDNARKHSGVNYVTTLDVKSFYESCRRLSVYNMFINKFQMAADVAGALTDLVVYENHVPTGAPTSQAITYFACHDTFQTINDLAIKYDYKFSLYVDDMTFSGSCNIPKALIVAVEQILRNAGLTIKWKKAKRYFPNQCKVITGVVLDKKGELRVPNSLRLKIVTGFDELRNNRNWNKTEWEKNKQSLLGRIEAARQIEPGIFSYFIKMSKQAIWNETVQIRE